MEYLKLLLIVIGIIGFFFVGLSLKLIFNKDAKKPFESSCSSGGSCACSSSSEKECTN